MPLTPETTTMANARPWSLLKFGDDIWLKALGTARLVFLRNMEITAFPAPVEEVDARHGPFEYLAPCNPGSTKGDALATIEGLINPLVQEGERARKVLAQVRGALGGVSDDQVLAHVQSFANAKWVLDNIQMTLGLSSSGGQNVLTMIGQLIEEHDEVVGLRTLMGNHVEEIQRLRGVLEATEFDLNRRSKQAETLASTNNDLRNTNSNLRAAIRRLSEEL